MKPKPSNDPAAAPPKLTRAQMIQEAGELAAKLSNHFRVVMIDPAAPLDPHLAIDGQRLGKLTHDIWKGNP